MRRCARIQGTGKNATGADLPANARLSDEGTPVWSRDWLSPLSGMENMIHCLLFYVDTSAVSYMYIVLTE